MGFSAGDIVKVRDGVPYDIDHCREGCGEVVSVDPAARERGPVLVRLRQRWSLGGRDQPFQAWFKEDELEPPSQDPSENAGRRAFLLYGPSPHTLQYLTKPFSEDCKCQHSAHDGGVRPAAAKKDHAERVGDRVRV